MRIIFTLTLFALSLLWSLQANGQDPRYSQFYAAPLQLNPAMIGVYQGQFRIVANYRELYGSILGNRPFRTVSASFDFRKQVLKGDYVGFGISALRDEAGISNFNRQQAHLGASFMKQLGGSRYATNDQYLIAGAQFGIGQHGLDWGKLWFSQQFVEEVASIDYGADNGEAFIDSFTDLYIDFNAGLLWYALFDDNQSIYLGGAFHHLNTPNISFMGEANEDLHMRWVLHAGGELPLGGENLSLLPAVAVMGQNQSMSATAGGNFRYTNRDWREVAIRAGVWAHVSNKLESDLQLDAIAVTAILETGRLQIGVGYDITTSQLATANNSRGAFELSLIYTGAEKSRRYRVNCPNF